MTGIVEFLTAQFDADEKRLREGWYGDVHWQALNNAAALGGWTAARQMGLTAEQCDQITDAASALVKERLEGWQRQEAEERLADLVAKRAIVEAVFDYEAKIDGEWGCCHGQDLIRAGLCPDSRPESIPILQALAAAYADRPGYKEGWRP